LSKSQRYEKGVDDREKSRTGGQYSCQYFTGGWIELKLIGIFFSITTPTVGYSDNSSGS